MKKILMNDNGKKFYVKDNSEDYHCQYGQFKKKDLSRKDGSKISTNKGKEFSIFTPSFIDLYRKIKRDAQIVPLKDIGLIIAQTGIGKDSKVLEAGAGSGAVGTFLSRLCKEIVSYEIRDDFIKVVKSNIDFLGIKNMNVKKKDIYEGITEKNLDLVMLDLPEPWKVIEHAAKSLKVGGFLVSYSPTIPQVQDFVNTLRNSEKFVHIKTSEIIEREWEVEDRKVRPRSRGIGHSGFLSFCRRI